MLRKKKNSRKSRRKAAIASRASKTRLPDTVRVVLRFLVVARVLWKPIE